MRTHVNSSQCDSALLSLQHLFPTHEAYASLSTQAHVVLGMFILSLVLVFTALVSRVKLKVRGVMFDFTSVPRALFLSGCLQLGMGIYLLIWVYVFLSLPSGNFVAGFEYVTTDLLQLQHTSIAMLLCGGGVLDIALGKGFLKNSNWHCVWATHITLVGILFMIHPQHDREGTVKHTVLGSCLVLGTMFMLAERKDGFSPNMEEAPNIILAGIGYTVAAALLLGYRENEAHEHVGRIAVCQGAWPVTLVGICFGAFTVVVSALGCLLVCIFGGGSNSGNGRRNRRKAGDNSASLGEYESLSDEKEFSFSQAVVMILYWLLCAVVAGGFWLIIFPLTLVTFGLRKLYGLLRCERGNLVSPQDAVWLQESQDAPMVINAVLVFEKAIDIQRLKVLFEERLGSNPVYSRMKSRVINNNGRFFWAKDEQFDVNHHIIAVTGWQKPDTEAELLKYVSNLAGEPLSSRRPLWQFLVVNGYEGDKSVGIWRCHHVLADGIVMSGILLDTLMDKPSLSPSAFSSSAATTEERAERRGRGGFKHHLMFLKALFEGPLLISRKMMKISDSSRIHGRQLSGAKKVVWSKPMDLNHVKAIKNELGCTLNDLLMALMTASLNAYVSMSTPASESVPPSVCVAVPINMRSSQEMKNLRMENKFAVLVLDMPLACDHFAERLDATTTLMNNIKVSCEPLVMYGAMRLCVALLPGFASRWCINAFCEACSVIMTNNRGSETPHFLDENRVLSWMSWAPQRSNIGLAVTIVSYDGQVKISITADRAVVNNPEVIIQEFQRRFQLLLGEAQSMTADSPTSSSTHAPVSLPQHDDVSVEVETTENKSLAACVRLLSD